MKLRAPQALTQKGAEEVVGLVRIALGFHALYSLGNRIAFYLIGYVISSIPPLYHIYHWWWVVVGGGGGGSGGWWWQWWVVVGADGGGRWQVVPQPSGLIVYRSFSFPPNKLFF